MSTPPGIFELTIRYDRGDHDLVVHPVAVETDRGVVLVDLGLPGSLGKLREALDTVDYALSEVVAVVLTHHDADHAGALAEFREESDALVLAHEREAPYVDGREFPVKADPGGDRYPPATVDLELAGGETLHTRAGPARIVETPGHTPGHVSLHFPDHRFLVAGDAVVADHDDDHLHGPKPQFTPDLDRAYDSVRTLADLDIDRTLCYHGGLVDEGTERLAELADTPPQD
jgi:glyoxylase-like metal-dependent hydrolase (beta-lactamase superfamily II)